MAVLTCKNLSVGYDKREVIRDLDFELGSGDYLCIVGENGSGKTTLMKTLLGLIPSISGEVSTGEGMLPNEIGYLPQQTDIQKDFPASVREIVISGTLNKARFRPFYLKKDKKMAKENMEKLSIYELRKECFRELSGGQRQRVLLARALCATSKLLLLDEPVSGLDPRATEEMYKVLDKLNKEGLSIIMITHDMKSLSYASHVLYLGREKFFGTIKEFEETSDYRTLIDERG